MMMCLTKGLNATLAIALVASAVAAPLAAADAPLAEISAAFLFERIEGVPATSQQAKDTVIGFDRGDVNWLRGYCHFLAALGELSLSVDGQKAFDCSAHLLFEKVETPHTFLLESPRAFDESPLENVVTISDVVSFIHQMTRLSIKEPARTKAALAHLEAVVVHAKELWKFILAETDDDKAVLVEFLRML